MEFDISFEYIVNIKVYHSKDVCMWPSHNYLIGIGDEGNFGKDCWSGCNQRQGPCNWCGSEGFCCRLGWEGNGCDGGMGAKGMGHVCTGKGNHRCKIFCKFSFDFIET